jgi:hypothetical protein
MLRVNWEWALSFREENPEKSFGAQGFRGLGFWNNEGLRDIGGIAVSLKQYLKTILAALAHPVPARRLTARHPLPHRERESEVKPDVHWPFDPRADSAYSS